MRNRGAGIGVAAVVCAVASGLGCGLDKVGLAIVGDDGGGEDAGFDVSAPPATAQGGPQGPGAAADAGGAADAGSPPDAASGPDGSDGSVSTPQPPPADAGCPGVLCNGQCTSASDCRACSGATLLCRTTRACVGDCASCAGAPIGCFACDGNRQNPLGTCEPQGGGTYCLDENYAGAYLDGGQGYHCGCTTAADCPGQSQVCIAIGSGPFACFTCGEAYTNTASCKSGQTCTEQQDRCSGL